MADSSEKGREARRLALLKKVQEVNPETGSIGVPKKQTTRKVDVRTGLIRNEKAKK